MQLTWLNFTRESPVVTEYTEFEWLTARAGNGVSGEKLTEVFAALAQKIDGVRSICDLGCGNGHIAGRLAGLGYEVTGIDASPSGIRIAQHAYPSVKFIEAMIDADVDLPRFDLVISSDVIEHLYRPSDLVETAFSVVKPGGHLLLGAPYHGYLKNLALAVTGRMDSHFSALHDGGHIKFFSVKTLSQLLMAHRFEDLSFTFYGRAPWLWKNMICHARKPAS